MGNAFEQKYYGFFRAIVIQNNDPERRGRVKLFMPDFAAQIARSLNLPPERLEARFTGGKNINTFLSKEVLQLLKDHVKWSEQAAPLMGSGTAGVYDIKNDIATVGEGHTGGDFEPLGEEGINPSGERVSPKAAYSVHGTPGLFGEGYKTGMCDTYNETLGPSSINNATKGMFSIPRVGAQVWVFFEDGNIDYPVYFGYVFDKNDWNTVFNPQDSNPDPHYPAGSENIPDNDAFMHTGKTVFNSKAGSLEFIDTDDFEKIKLSHYSGSYHEMSNHHTTEVAIENKIIVVNENETHTVKGDRGLYVKGDSHERYDGKRYIVYGDMDLKSIYQDWADAADPAFAHAALFADKERTVVDPTTTGEAKGGPNDNYSHPPELTLKPKTSWTDYLKNINPSDYMKLDQLKVLGVTKA
jgi:hypothetical protein